MPSFKRPVSRSAVDATCLRVHRAATSMQSRNRLGGGHRGRLIASANGGMNTELQTVAGADGRPAHFFMSAGQGGDCSGAAVLLGRLPKADGLLDDRDYDAHWLRDALKNKGIKPCVPG